METINCLKIRRSTRSFKTDSIPREVLRQILETACYAPSSKNTQPWEFFILTGKEKDYICDLVIKEYPKRGKPFRKREEAKPISTSPDTKNYENFRTPKVMTNTATTIFVRQAPVLILVFNKAPYTAGENNVIKEPSKESLLAYSVEVQSVAAFVFSVLLTAHDLGLGGCWIADFNFCCDKIKEYIGTENDLVAGIVLGYPEVTVPPKKIELPEEKIEFWTKK